MAKISTYPFPSAPSLSDYVIGTDTADSLNTKNFMISDILSLSGSSVYVPYIGATADVDLGTHSLYTGGIAFNNNGTIVDGNNVQGTLGQVLTSQGPGASPLWANIPFSGYVPYTGATNDLNLGTNKLITSKGIDLLGITTPINLLGSNGYNYDVLISQGSNTPIWAPISSVVSAGELIKASFYGVYNQYFSTTAPSSFPIIIDGINFAYGGISVVSDGTNLTRIQFLSSTRYSISFAPFVVNSSGSSHVVSCFLSKNGITAPFHIPNTRSIFTVGGNNYDCRTFNHIVSVNSGDYISIMFSTSSTTINLGTETSASYPFAPSIVVNINQC